MKTRIILICLAMICAPQVLSRESPTASQTQDDTFSFTSIHGQAPGKDASIADFNIGTTRFAPNGQTGDLSIKYVDGTEVVTWKAPKKKITMPAMGAEDDELIGVAQIEVAANRRVIGWAEMAAPCCESYPLPISVGIYRSGQRVLHIQGPGMLDYWTFHDNGRHIVAVWGPAHGPQILEYQIIDVKKRRVTAEVIGDPKTQALDPDVPK